MKTPVLLFYGAAIAGLLLGHSCSKKDPVETETPKENLEKELAEQRTHNAGIIPGAGNLFIAANPKASAAIAHTASLALDGDSIAFFGTTDASGKVTVTHTLGLFPTGGKAGAILQTHVTNGTLSVSSNQQGNGQTPSLFLHEQGDQLTAELRWHEGGAYRTIASAHYQGGQKVAQLLQMDTNPSANTASGCEPPTAASAQDSLPDMTYLRCRYTETLQQARQLIEDYIASGGEYAAETTILADLQDRLAAILEKLDGITDLKAHTTDLGNTHPQVIQDYTSVSAPETGSLSDLVVQPSEPAYAEREGDTLLFHITKKRTSASTSPLYARIRIIRPDNDGILLSQTLAVDTAAVAIRFRPKDIEGYRKLSHLVIGYALVSDTTEEVRVEVPMAFITPKAISAHAGNGQQARQYKAVENALKVKVTATDGLPIAGQPVDWRVVGGGTISADKSTTDGDGIATLPKWTLGGNGEQAVIASFIHEGKTYERQFTASFAKNKYSLAICHPCFPDNRVLRDVWEDGDDLTLYSNMVYHVDLLIDGVSQHMGYNVDTKHIAALEDPSFNAFSDRDLVLERYPIYTHYRSEADSDTIFVNLRITNAMQRSIVGRTLTYKRHDDDFYNLPGEILSVKLSNNGKATVTSSTQPQKNGPITYEISFTGFYQTFIDTRSDGTDTTYHRKVLGMLTFPKKGNDFADPVYLLEDGKTVTTTHTNRRDQYSSYKSITLQ